MTTNLPDLSTWNRVPVGAAIPADTPYAYHYEKEGFFAVKLSGHLKEVPALDGEPTYYTEHPIGLPLPTEDGATILATDDDRPPRILLTLEAGQWVSGLGLQWNVEQFRAWCPVTLGETVVVRP